MILLNKTDLVDDARIRQVYNTINELNPTLRVHKTVQSRIPLKEIFNLRAFSSHQATLSSLAQEPAAEGSHDQDHGHEHSHNHGHDHEHDSTREAGAEPTRHSSALSTTLVPLPALSQEQYARLNAFLESVLWENKLPRNAEVPGTRLADQQPISIVRTKGYIVLEDGREYVLQGVTDIFEVSEINHGADSSTAPPTAGKVVFIGRGLEGVKESLQQYLSL